MIKRILITGSGSYIGKSLEDWLNQPRFTGMYEVKTVDMQDTNWKVLSFNGYDTVFHVAGIAHQKNHVDEKVFDNINHLLAVEVFKKCINDGVAQFIFMSSAAVFGQNDKYNKNITVGKNTKPNPKTVYGQTKLRAEMDMLNILKQDINIALAIIRPPMIYGPQAKGNYPRLSKAIQNTLFFPNIHNQRSMLFIDNFCECIRLIIEKQDQGFFHPQNSEYVDVSRLALEIAEAHGKKIVLTNIFNPILNFAAKLLNPINKVFGNYIYEKELSDHYNWDYCIFDEKTTINRTESLRGN